jgi:hypothetical protein
MNLRKGGPEMNPAAPKVFRFDDNTPPMLKMAIELIGYIMC